MSLPPRDYFGETVEFHKLSERHRRQWDQACFDQSPFFSPRFTEATAEARKGGVSVTIIKDENGAIGYLPFQLRDRHLGYAEKIGGGMSDYFAPILPETCDLTLERALSLTGLHSFRFDHFPAGARQAGAMDVETSLGLKLNIGESGQIYLTALKHNNADFVKKIIRREKQLAAEHGPLRFEWHSQAPYDDLAHLIQVKKDQYSRTGFPDALREQWTTALLANLISRKHGACFAVISTLFAGSTWVASHYGLCSPPLLHCWFPAYNHDLLRFGPGHILRRHMIANATDHGITTFDLGQGENPHKKEYITAEYPLQKGIWRAPGFLGFVDRVSASIGWRLESARKAARRRAA